MSDPLEVADAVHDPHMVYRGKYDPKKTMTMVYRSKYDLQKTMTKPMDQKGTNGFQLQRPMNYNANCGDPWIGAKCLHQMLPVPTRAAIWEDAAACRTGSSCPARGCWLDRWGPSICSRPGQRHKRRWSGPTSAHPLDLLNVLLSDPAFAKWSNL